LQVDNVFLHDSYLIRRKVLQIFGASFHVFDDAGNVVAYSRQKAFKLKEDIRLYTDESCTTELLVILARQIMDFSASYDVVDAQASEPVGTLRRHGIRSLFRDKWTMLSAEGVEVGQLEEDSLLLALLRRQLGPLLPQTFDATAAGVPLATYKQNFNPFVRKLAVTIHPEAQGRLDRRLLLAGGILLAAIEGRQRGSSA
jgi:uncharacterized protein YxjI